MTRKSLSTKASIPGSIKPHPLKCVPAAVLKVERICPNHIPQVQPKHDGVSMNTANADAVWCRRTDIPGAERHHVADQPQLTSFQNSGTCELNVPYSFYLEAPNATNR